MKYADRVEESTTSVGLTAVILSGSAPAGKNTFAGSFTVGQSNIPYLIDNDAGAWEVGIGTLASATLFNRDIAVGSSNGGAKVDFGAGTKRVICTLPATVMSYVSVDPDDVGFDIFLLAGQSNMSGNANKDSTIDDLDTRVSQYGADTTNNTTYHKICAAVDTLSGQNGGTANMGPGTWLGKAYSAAVPSNRKVLLVPCAVGSSALCVNGAEWGYPSGTRYLDSISHVNSAILAALDLYPSSRFVGVIWVQGEAESGTGGVSTDTYKTAWKATMNGWKAAITGASKMLVIIGSMTPEILTDTSGFPSAANIWAAHEELPDEYPNTVFVEGPTGMNEGSYHYSAPGYRVFGSRMGIAIKAARMGVTYSETVPDAPTIGTASPGNSSASVTFTPPANDGGATILNYTATSNPGNVVATGAVSPIVIPGLTNGVSYTFKVYATNSVGDGPQSASSNAVIPVNSLTVPDAPTIGTASVTGLTASVAFTPPANNGGSTITGYTATSTPGGLTGTGVSSPISVPNLVGNTTYTFTVHATNAVGDSPESAASNQVTPVVTYTTLNPADKNSGVTLSNGNLTATGPAWSSVRASGEQSNGKWYFEATVTNKDFIVGLGNSAASLDSFPGSDTNGCGIRAEGGTLYGVGSGGSFGVGTENGDIIAVAVDMVAHTIAFKIKNVGTWGAWSTAYALPAAFNTTPVMPMMGLGGGIVTLNFGASAWAATPPAGHSGWTV